MAERLLDLMHGTADSIVPEVILKIEPLIGRIFPHDQSHSGMLTNHRKIAELGALEKVVWGGNPVILHYSIPENQTVCHGAIGGNTDDFLAFSTVVFAASDALSLAYLEGIGLTPEEAAIRIARGDELFSIVPPEYLVHVEKIENPLAALLLRY